MKKNTALYLATGLIAISICGSSVLAFVNGQNAHYVLGQSNFTTNVAGPSATNSVSANDVAYDSVNSRLFVADTSGNRIMVYDLSGAVSNGMPASGVIGQPDFVSSSPGLSQSTMHSPMKVLYDASDQWLFVADYFNYRVLIYDLSVSSMTARWVLGQPDFVSNGNYCFPGQLNAWNNCNVMGMAYDPVHKRFFLGTSQRILVYDFSPTGTPLNASTTFPISATVVLGQPDFSTMNTGTIVPSSSDMIEPRGLYYDTTHQWLFVGDTNSLYRVMIFDLSGGITNNMNAGWVLGQQSLTTTAPSYMTPSQNTLSAPYSTTYDPATSQLFVADAGSYNRVLVFNLSGGVTNGMNASVVLGQTNFTSTVYPMNQNHMAMPWGVTYDPTRQQLFVEDANRTLVFDQIPGNGPQACNNPATICGKVVAAEDQTPLPNVPVQLQDNEGRLLSTQKTDNSGNFSFNGRPTNSQYFVTSVLSRQESASPVRYPITNFPSMGAVANLQVRGYPGSLQVTGMTAGSAVLISTYSYTGATMPTLSASSSLSYYVGTAGQNGTYIQQLPKLPTGQYYYVTCWMAQTAGATVSYMRIPANNSITAPEIEIGQFASVQCH